MFGIRELKERVAKLEEELGKRTKALESAMDYQDEVAKFLLEHDRNEIVLNSEYKVNRSDCTIIKGYKVKYAYDGKLKCVDVPCFCNILTITNIQEIDALTSLIEFEELYTNEDKLVTLNKYYQLNKSENTLTDITETRKALLKETEKETKVKENLENNEEKSEPKKEPYDKNGIKYKDTRYSELMQYYTKYNLNVDIRDFKPIKRMGRKEAATLLYLFDKYKYISEIAKHVNLSKSSLVAYAYALRRAGYLIYEHEVGRVANGCLIYGN